MNQFSLRLEAKNTSVKLFVKNERKQDCYIPDDSLMLNGFLNDKFQVISEEGERAVYQGMIAKYFPEYVLIKAHQTLTNEVDLAEEYLFHTFGSYSISYNSYISCCADNKGNNCIDYQFISASNSSIISIDEADVFKGIYETYNDLLQESEPLNIMWCFILSKRIYWRYIFQSHLLDKMNSRIIHDLLSLPYQLSDGDIPLGYIIKNYEFKDLELFLNSNVFSKLSEGARYKQYSYRNDYEKSILDLALKKSYEHFNLLLNCGNCFVKLSDRNKLDLIESDASPVIHNAFYFDVELAKSILNNEVLVNMEARYKVKMLHHILHYQTGIIGPQPNPFITDNADNLFIFKSSKVFASLDNYNQDKLLFGEYNEAAGIVYDL